MNWKHPIRTGKAKYLKWVTMLGFLLWAEMVLHGFGWPPFELVPLILAIEALMELARRAGLHDRHFSSYEGEDDVWVLGSTEDAPDDDDDSVPLEGDNVIPLKEWFDRPVKGDDDDES